MKKIVFLLIASLIGIIPVFCQEVIIFVDDRSMVVKSHSEKEGFIYLKIEGGEIAFPKKQVKEIRKEDGSKLTTTNTGGQPSFSGEKVVQPKTIETNRQKMLQGLQRKSPLQKKPPAREKVEKDEDEEDDESDLENDDDDSDDEDDESEEVNEKPIQPKPITPQRFPKKMSDQPGTSLGPIRKR
jgi:hypothetical protein